MLLQAPELLARHPPSRDALRSVQRRVWAAAASFIVLSGILVALALLDVRSQALASGDKLGESLAQVVEEQTSRTVQTIDQQLQLAVSGIAQLQSEGNLSEASAHALLREQIQGLPFLRALWMLDARGRIVYDSDLGNIGVDLSDRTYFQIYKTLPQTAFHVGVPVRSRTTGTWLISATRPVRRADGSLVGVVVAAVEPPYFDKLWRSVDLGAGGSIGLFRVDGTLMMRSPFDEAAMGKKHPEAPDLGQMSGPDRAGTFERRNQGDGTVRSYAFRALVGYPDMVVVVGQARDLVLAPWRWLAGVALVIWVIAGLAIVSFCFFLQRAWQLRASAEARVEQMANRLGLATDAASIGVWDWDVGRADQWYATPTYFTMMGYPPDEGIAVREQWIERLHPLDRERVVELIRQVLEGADRQYAYEARFRHADGGYRWVHVEGRVLARDPAGKPTRLMGVRLDITERKNIEEALREGEARYRALFEANPHPMWVYDQQTLAFLAANDAAVAHYGYSREEFLAMTIRDIRPPEDLPLLARQLVSVPQLVQAAEAWRHMRKDGSVILVEISSHTLEFAGRAARLILAHDVTERRRAEDQLRLSEQNLAITLKSIGDAVIATDTSGAITRLNDAAERLTGWLVSEALGQPLEHVFRIVNAQTRMPSPNPVQLVMESGEVVGLANHTTLMARDGSEYQIADSAAPIRDASGAITGVVLVFSDVTEQYRVRQSLATTLELLERTGEMAQVGGWELDLDSMRLFWSQETSRIHQLEPGSAPSLEQAIAFYAPQAQVEMRAAIQAAIQQGTSWDLELPLVGALGRAAWVRTQGFAVMQDGRVLKLRGALHDITERKRAEQALQASQQRYRVLFEYVPDGMLIGDPQGRYLDANPSICKMLGYTREELVGRDATDIVLPDELPQIDLAIDEMRSSSNHHREWRFRRKDGSVLPAEVLVTVMPDGNLLAMLRDVTERQQAQARIQASQQSLLDAALHTQTILDNMADCVIASDVDGRVQAFNKAACTVFGYAADEVIGQPVAMLMADPLQAYQDTYGQQPHTSGEARTPGQLREVEGKRKDGSLFPMNLSVSKISRAGQTSFIAIVRDITQHRKDVEEIRRLAFYDLLTGLPNRRLLLDRLKQAMVTSARSGQHGALMFLDLDHFKQLNDSLGHDVGDILLQQVAARLQACVREGDSVARLGGDEFVVLLEGLSNHEQEAATQAEVVAIKVLETFGQPFKLREHAHEGTPSIGIVVFLGDQQAMDDLLKNADVAMYQAKSAGRNTARFFDPAMQAAVAAHEALEKDLRRGLAQQEFVLHYQVQVDAAGLAVGAEALVRWNHPQRGLVAPGDFIALAEETGLILPLGQWVLECACAQLVAWSREPLRSHWVLAVNVSALQFAQADFVAHVEQALAKTGANPRLLKLELTESMLVDDVKDVIAKMGAIKERGVGFSLDDFGTGYSSLSYLKRLPLDQLKIDQSFVRDILSDASDAVIARTIVALGHSLGLSVVAEGVELAEQLELLRGMGCDGFQGYHFGHPAPELL